MDAQRPPNVILLMADQISAHHLGSYGDTAGATPHLDALAAGGVRFDRAYCASPVCIPTRASLYSGQYPHTHGKMTHIRMPMEPRPSLLPEVLAADGYNTGLVGKTHFYPPGDPMGCDLAHLTIDAPLAYELVPQDAYVRFLQERGALAGLGLEEITAATCRATANRVRGLPESLHRATWTGDTACEVLRELTRRPGPFFLLCSFVEPHGAEPCPPEYEGRFAGKIREPIAKPNELDGKPEIQRHFDAYYRQMLEGRRGCDYESMRHDYYSLVNLVDHNIGKILQAVDELGQAEDTVVVFVTDHGESLGDHDMWGKCMFYDSCARVPLIVRGPGVAAGQVSQGLLSHVDIMPTLLDLCHTRPGDLLLDGRSFADLLRDPTSPGQTAVFGELFQNQCMPEGVLCNCKMVRSGRWKYVYYTHGPTDELYDLENDPHELEDLAGQPTYATQVERLRGMLLQWLAESEANRLHPTAENHYPVPRWGANV